MACHIPFTGLVSESPETFWIIACNTEKFDELRNTAKGGLYYNTHSWHNPFNQLKELLQTGMLTTFTSNCLITETDNDVQKSNT